MNKKGISIIICCYNSESRLPKTLEYLSQQTISKDIPVELIIVNNASTDNTKEVALKEWNKYSCHFSFQIIDEEKPGQMFARKRGAQEAQYEYVLFCDDDNWLQSDYLQIAFDLMESDDKIGALGGQSIAVSEIDFPDWFPEFAEGYAVGKQLEESGDISKKGLLWGAGMVARNSLLNKVFNSKYPMLIDGRTEGKLISGDDSEICKRILLLGYSLYYDNSLLFYHNISPNRLTLEYKNRLWEGFDISWKILVKYEFVYIEMKKSRKDRMRDISYSFKRILKTKGEAKKYWKTKLLVRIGLLLKMYFVSNDLEYRKILKFYLGNTKNK